jgi:hypothetical protein
MSPSKHQTKFDQLPLLADAISAGFSGLVEASSRNGRNEPIGGQEPNAKSRKEKRHDLQRRGDLV